MSIKDITMEKIIEQHYTQTVIFETDRIIKSIKSILIQYLNGLNLGITAEQFMVLDAIYCNDGICQQELSELLLKDKSNTKRIVNVLENNGLIKIKLSKKNNRSVNKLNITKAGKKIIDENRDNVKSFALKMFKSVSEEDLKILKNIGHKIKDDLSCYSENV